MRTLQEQYNLIKEGKGHKDVFMKSARRLFPEYITNFATYNEAVTILKQKSILNEAVGGIVTQKSANPFVNWDKFLSEEAKAEEKKTTKEVEDMETAGYDYKDPKNSNNLNFEEMLRGYYAEMKDSKNVDKTEEELREMVAKNLAKDTTYYSTNQAFGEMGIGYSEDHPGLGPTKEVKGKYASSGMEEIKLKEDMIKLTDLINEAIGGYVDLRPAGMANENARTDAEEEGYLDGKADEKKKIEKDLKEAKDVINHLRSELNEVNLLNSKLLYTNKIFRGKTLTENQKIKVLKAFDKAETVKEAKNIFETLNENLVAKSIKSNIRESLGMASKSAGVAPKRPLNENVIQEDAMVARFKKLAGIN